MVYGFALPTYYATLVFMKWAGILTLLLLSMLTVNLHRTGKREINI
jgi:hypothetical protein